MNTSLSLEGAWGSGRSPRSCGLSDFIDLESLTTVVFVVSYQYFHNMKITTTSNNTLKIQKKVVDLLRFVISDIIECQLGNNCLGLERWLVADANRVDDRLVQRPTAKTCQVQTNEPIAAFLDLST